MAKIGAMGREGGSGQELVENVWLAVMKCLSCQVIKTALGK